MVLNSRVMIAVGVHLDDIELGCGGSLYQIVKSKRKVIAVFMTKGELSRDPEMRQKGSRD